MWTGNFSQITDTFPTWMKIPCEIYIVTYEYIQIRSGFLLKFPHVDSFMIPNILYDFSPAAFPKSEEQIQTTADSDSCLQYPQCISSQFCRSSSSVESQFSCPQKNSLSHWRLCSRGWLRSNTGLRLLRGGSGISQTRQLLIPDPNGVRTPQAAQILVLQATPPLTLHPAERALATHAEVTEGKYPQEKGHCLGFPPRAFRAGGLCWVLVSGREEVSGLR